MTAVSKCQAKDPSKCRFHGNPKPAVDAFEEALKCSGAFHHIEALLFYKKEKMKQLADNYDRHRELLTETITGYSNYDKASVRALEAYNTEYEDLVGKLSSEALISIREYSGIMYDPVNKFLRDREAYIGWLKPEFKEKNLARVSKTIEGLDEAFAMAPVRDNNRILYRVLSQDLDKEFDSSEAFAAKAGYVEGADITFKSYLSTSVDSHFVNHRIKPDEEEHTDIVFIISTRKGIPVGRTATHPDEHQFTQDGEREILLPRDMKFRVKKVTRSVEFENQKFSYMNESVRPLTVYLEER